MIVNMGIGIYILSVFLSYFHYLMIENNIGYVNCFSFGNLNFGYFHAAAVDKAIFEYRRIFGYGKRR